MVLINCKIDIDLSWSTKFVAVATTLANQRVTFSKADINFRFQLIIPNYMNN